MSRLWRLLLAALVAAVAAGCAASPAVSRPPALDQAALAALLAGADQARDAAFAAADPAPLRPLFADAALAPLRAQLDGLRRRGESLHVRGAVRRLVHWTAGPGSGSAEGVLEVSGEERLVAGGSPLRDWTRFLRQWFAAVRWSGARWLVVDARELPPDQWWKA